MSQRWNHKSAKKEAKRFKKLGEWIRISHGSYDYAKRHGLIHEYSKHMDPQFLWTYESVRAEALKYKSKKDWVKNSIGSYQFAVRNKLLKELSPHMINPRIKWNENTVSLESLKYRSVKEWILLSHGSYNYAWKNKLLNKLTKHMIDIRKFPEEQKRLSKLKKPDRLNKQDKIKEEKKYKKIFWNPTLVKKESLKYSTRSEWSAYSPSSLKYAKKHKDLYNSCIKHMGSPLSGKKRTKKECLQSAKKYTTKQQWKKSDSKTYSFAKKHGWIEDCSTHMIKTTPPGHWRNEQNAINEMKKYSTRRELIAHNPSGYVSIKRHFKHLLDKWFPLIEYASTSMGENSARIFLEKIFNCAFVKENHNFLINPKTGRKLELDGYAEKLGLAFEYGNHKSLEFRVGKEGFKKLIARDKFKKEKCQEMGIKLLQLTMDSMEFKNPREHLKKQIKNELIRMNVTVPNSFDQTPLEIIQFVGKKWNKETIWEAVKMTRNITDLQIKHGSAYDVAVKLGIIEEIRSYYVKKLKSQKAN